MRSSTECAKSATGYDGKKIGVGDPVISKHGVRGTVQSIKRRGYAGTIVYTDTAPDPKYPHHKQGAAKSTYRRDVACPYCRTDCGGSCAEIGL